MTERLERPESVPLAELLYLPGYKCGFCYSSDESESEAHGLSIIILGTCPVMEDLVEIVGFVPTRSVNYNSGVTTPPTESINEGWARLGGGKSSTRVRQTRHWSDVSASAASFHFF